MVRWHRTTCLAVAAALIVAWAGIASAGDAGLAGATRGISLHLAYYPATPRAAGMGVSTVAVAGVDSHNPAALAWVGGLDVAFDYGRCNFHSGPDLDMYRGHVVFPMPVVGGYMKLMGLGVSTRNEHDTTRMGVDVHIWAREFGFGYGRDIPLPDGIPGRLALGAGGFPSDPSEVRASLPDGTKLGSGRGHSKLGSIRAGLLYEPVKQVAIGVQYTHVLDYLYANWTGAPRMYDRYHVNIFQYGIALKPDDKTVISLQHLSGRASGEGVYGNADDRQTFDYFSAGIERKVPITETFGMALRAGMYRGEFTCGLGLALPDDFRIDYAYMPHFAYDLRNEFGTAALHTIGVGKSF